MLFLNLGCGSRFHPDWVNLDLKSSSPYVKAVDIRKGIPYPDQTFSVVYHSHLLEHLTKRAAVGFLRECNRVLVPGGVIRVVVPDLEQIVRAYLSILDKSTENTAELQYNYEWITLELLDQLVREHSGGEMGKYLRQVRIPNLKFIYERIGGEARGIVTAAQNAKPPVKKQRHLIRTISHFPAHLKIKLTRHLLGTEDYSALELGRFRMSGEVHQWMYDRYSLGKLLEVVGFLQVTKREANESAIDNWQSFNLDTEPDGSVYKPESLFMEAIKP